MEQLSNREGKYTPHKLRGKEMGLIMCSRTKGGLTAMEAHRLGLWIRVAVCPKRKDEEQDEMQ